MHVCRCLLKTGVDVLEHHNYDENFEMFIEVSSEKWIAVNERHASVLFKVCKEVAPFNFWFCFRAYILKKENCKERCSKMTSKNSYEVESLSNVISPRA